MKSIWLTNYKSRNYRTDKKKTDVIIIEMIRMTALATDPALIQMVTFYGDHL